MLKKLTILIHAGLLIGLLAPSSRGQDQNFVVRLGTGADVVSVAARNGMTVVRSLAGSATGIHVLSAPAGQAPAVTLQNLASDPYVLSAEPDGAVLHPGQDAAAAIHPASAVQPVLPIDGTPVSFFGMTVANGYINQPAAAIINLSQAQGLATGTGTVAVLDTGIDLSQPVLLGSLVPGWDFVNGLPGGQEIADINQETTPILDQETTPILDQETTPILDGGSAIVLTQETTPILDQETTPILDNPQLYPAYGHGTMVAGLIHLVAPTASIMPVKVFAADGTATISRVIEGLYWAVDNGADVINMSFSTRLPSQTLKAALQYAYSQGVICVSAAGNDGAEETLYPAAYDGYVIAVASTDNQEIRSLFSNFGDHVDLAAPGEGVITTYPGNHYAMVWGTSFSAPMVAGAAALFLQVNKSLNAWQARSALSQAEAIGQELGAGELDLFRSLSYLLRSGRDD